MKTWYECIILLNFHVGQSWDWLMAVEEERGQFGGAFILSILVFHVFYTLIKLVLSRLGKEKPKQKSSLVHFDQ